MANQDAHLSAEGHSSLEPCPRSQPVRGHTSPHGKTVLTPRLLPPSHQATSEASRGGGAGGRVIFFQDSRFSSSYTPCDLVSLRERERVSAQACIPVSPWELHPLWLLSPPSPQAGPGRPLPMEGCLSVPSDRALLVRWPGSIYTGNSQVAALDSQGLTGLSTHPDRGEKRAFGSLDGSSKRCGEATETLACPSPDSRGHLEPRLPHAVP